MKMAAPTVDVCLISGARPELLFQTLDSFQNRLLKKLNISKCIANVDLFGGDESQRGKCVDLVLDYFRQAEVYTPPVPHFTAAVKRVLERTSQSIVLHLEDDWLLREDVEPELLFSKLNEETRALKFLFKEKNKNLQRDGQFDIDWIRRKFLGITWQKKPYNRHSTSPGFFDGDFIREWAARMDLSLDPEKQAKPFLNPHLFEYVSRYRSELVAGLTQPELIMDIGRAWRNDHGVMKQTVDGRSEWKKIPDYDCCSDR